MPELFLANEAETEELGLRIGRALAPSTILLLDGELGAGKTTVTRGIARGLGVEGEVTSPTFLTLKVYATSLGVPLLHVDLYRVAAEAYLEEQGILDEVDEGAIAVVEWGEKAGDLQGYRTLELRITEEGEGRRAVLSAGAEWKERLERVGLEI